MERKVVKIKDIEFGSGKFEIIAGPCAIESKEQLLKVVKVLKENNIKIMRASAYKPRTKPSSFQGLEEKGLEILDEVRKETGIITETEITSPEQVDFAKEKVDILRVGARNMQNYFLLKEVGKCKKAVLLKRGMSATYKELLMAAEYVMSEGNHNVILCERGIRTFENYTRNTLDLVSIPVLNKLSHLPIIIDPSHATGHWDLVGSAAKGAVAMGADGLIIEVHPEPSKALSDGQQSLKFETFSKLSSELKQIAEIIGREI